MVVCEMYHLVIAFLACILPVTPLKLASSSAGPAAAAHKHNMRLTLTCWVVFCGSLINLVSVELAIELEEGTVS